MTTDEPGFGACRKCGRLLLAGQVECVDCDSDFEAADRDPAVAAASAEVWQSTSSTEQSPGQGGSEPELNTRVLGRRVGGALLDLIPLTLLMVGFASMWGRLGEQANGSWEFWLSGWAFVAFGVAALGVYFVQEAIAAATFGKWIVGLRVVRPDGSPIGAKEAAIRTVLRIIDGLPLLYLVGFVAARLDDSRRRLGDKAAGSVVAALRSVADGPTPLARPASTWPIATVGVVSVAVAVFGVGLLRAGDGGFDPITPANQEELRDALLRRGDIAALPLLPTPIREVSLADASAAANPDPRGPCGAKDAGDLIESLARPDAVAIFQGDGLLIMTMLLSGGDPDAAIAATRDDMRDGCDPYYTHTPYGYRQYNQYEGAIDLSTLGVNAVGTSHRLGQEGAASMLYAEQGAFVVGDNLVAVMVLSFNEPPEGFLSELAEAALGKARAFGL